MKFRTFGMILFSVLLSAIAAGKGSAGPVNYLNTPLSLALNDIDYNLAWSSHPQGNYYKQEYLRKGEKAEKYTSMLMLEVLTSKLSPKDAAAGKIAELQRMKAGNPYITFETSYNAGKDEQILDFIITANSPDGKEVVIAERNVYRYTTLKNKDGSQGLLLLAISVRSYGQESKKFLENSKTGKATLVTKLKDFKIPPVSMKPDRTS